MPSRLLREGILDSEAVNSLSPAGEVFYRRLMSVVDDFGRFDGRAAVLRGRLYALQLDRVREADVVRWIAECEKANLIRLYTVGGKPYLLFRKLGPARAKESRYPPPPDDEREQPCADNPVPKHPQTPVNGPDSSENPSSTQTQTDENSRLQTRADVPYSGSDSGTDSGSGTDSTSGSAGVGQSDPPFDPLRLAQEHRRVFVERWNQAGLKPLTRLSHGLHARLEALLGDLWWAEHYPQALARAGKIPYLAAGVDRKNGPLDVSDFLRDDDFVRKVLDGVYDPRQPTPKPTKSAGVDSFLNTV